MVVFLVDSQVFFGYNLRLYKYLMSSMQAIKIMGMLMSRISVNLDDILTLVQILNKSYFECQHVIIILQDVFVNQKSAKILLSVEILQCLVKNCNKNFHQAANKEPFQKKLLALLKRVRGKSNFLKDLKSNSQNWNTIEAKVLYLVQLWYDAFILEESVYNNIINTYKILRKENIMFPPRSVNEKNMLFVKTESPILDSIQQIARRDHQKFAKKLNSMGMHSAVKKMEVIHAQEIKRHESHKIDLDEISQKIAIVRSNEYIGENMIKLIQEIRKDLEHGRVQPFQQKYWIDIREAGQILINQWQQKNIQFIREYEKRFLQQKLGLKNKKNKKVQPQQIQQYGDFKEATSEVKPQAETKVKEEINLLDL